MDKEKKAIPISVIDARIKELEKEQDYLQNKDTLYIEPYNRNKIRIDELRKLLS
jgi:hypothetical protein